MTEELYLKLMAISKVTEENKNFMAEMCDKFNDDPEQAKGFYYEKKMDIHVGTPQGKKERNDMLRLYLEGMQWVLFYYYCGVKHWGFYYPYHFPPMISDLSNIEELLGGKNEIHEFTSQSDNTPFHPYQ